MHGIAASLLDGFLTSSRLVSQRLHLLCAHAVQRCVCLPLPSLRSHGTHTRHPPLLCAELDKDYECPQCAAPKSRFAGYDAETGKVQGKLGGVPQIVNIVGAIGLIGTIALVGLGLSS